MKHALISARRLPSVALRQVQNAPGYLALGMVGGMLIAMATASSAAPKVAIKLQGDIVEECAVTGSLSSGTLPAMGTITLPDITRSGRIEYGFVVNCNTPFDYRLEAKHGALTHSDGGAAVTGFANSVPYDVAITIPTDGATISDRCSGESIRFGQARCRFSNSGESIALASRSSLTLAWAPQGILQAGKYAEKLTLTVGARQ